jgi:hypothetical protein
MDATDEPDLLHCGTETTAFLDDKPIEFYKEYGKLKAIITRKTSGNTSKSSQTVHGNPTKELTIVQKTQIDKNTRSKSID